MWLVDSTKFIDWIRQGQNPSRILKPYILAGLVTTCGVVRVEVLRGVIKPAARDELSRLFDALSEIPVTATTWKAIGQLAWELDRNGGVIPVTDLVIAGCALAANATVVTSDPHFARIPHLRVHPDLPKLG